MFNMLGAGRSDLVKVRALIVPSKKSRDATSNSSTNLSNQTTLIAPPHLSSKVMRNRHDATIHESVQLPAYDQAGAGRGREREF